MKHFRRHSMVFALVLLPGPALSQVSAPAAQEASPAVAAHVGLILFDALTNERQVKEILLPGMAELGLDPNDLKYLVVTHGHVDHYGGAPYLKQEYGVPILMSEADWNYLPDDISMPYFVRANYPPVIQPERDRVVQDGEVLILGDASVTFLVTPGHTPGTLSAILTVKDRGEPRTVAMWGGQALPGAIGELSQMHGSLHRFWNLGREQGVEGLISTHPWVVGNFELHARGSEDGGNPLLIGQYGFDRVMGIYDECIKAQFARSLARHCGIHDPLFFQSIAEHRFEAVGVRTRVAAFGLEHDIVGMVSGQGGAVPVVPGHRPVVVAPHDLEGAQVAADFTEPFGDSTDQFIHSSPAHRVSTTDQ